ncbi:hypothetical protein Tco_0014736 [Tanacetum coccineum]
MLLRTPVIWAVVHAKTWMCAFRSSCNFSLVLVCSCLPMVIVCSGYWSFTTIFSSASTQLRISCLSACHALLAIFCSFSGPCELFSKKRVQIPFGIWNFIAPWIVDTTIPICCMAVLPSSRLCGESDLTMTKLSIFVIVRRLSPIMISRGTSPKGHEYSPEKPTSEVIESTRTDLIDGFNIKKQCS